MLALETGGLDFREKPYRLPVFTRKADLLDFFEQKMTLARTQKSVG